MIDLLDTLLAQCGFRRERLTLGWIAGGAFSLLAFFCVKRVDDVLCTALYFVATSAFYYAGNAWCLAQHGARDEEAWQAYECLLGMMFFNQSLGFSAVVSLSSPGARLPGPDALIAVVGCALTAFGLVIKTWATRVVGIDCYYYKDLFFRRRVWSFSRKGPYAFLSSPMYGAGNLHLYGLAILSRSLLGLVAAALCHVAIFAFYYVVEEPFVAQIVTGG